jgi:CDGSH-type Zn-finger protein
VKGVADIIGPDHDVTPCGDNGPLLVRGASHVVTDDGQAHPVTRPVVAVCTCQRSQRFPWCDSTHKSVRRRAD